MIDALLLREFTTALRPVKTVRATWTTAGGGPAGSFLCHYESAAPKGGGPIDFETGNGYGYFVYPDERVTPVALAAGDVLTVAGMTLEVQEYSTGGNLSSVRRAWCTRR